MTLRISALAGLALLVLGATSLPAFASTALVIRPVHALGGPGTNFAAVLDLVANNKVGVLWCGPANFDWCLVQFHRKAGWVHTADLRMLSDTGVPLDGPTPNGPNGVPQSGPGDVHRLYANPPPPSHISPPPGFHL